jgi:hypothetical protein
VILVSILDEQIELRFHVQALRIQRAKAFGGLIGAQLGKFHQRIEGRVFCHF